MPIPIDIVVLQGQSNAQLIGHAPLREDIFGSPQIGSVLQLACQKASIALGLDPSHILGVSQVGFVNYYGSVFAGTSTLPSSYFGDGSSWFNYVDNNDQSKGITTGNYDSRFQTYVSYVANTLTSQGYIFNQVAIIEAHNESDEGVKAVADNNPGLNNWINGRVADLSNVANAFGKDYNSVSLMFWWVPYNLPYDGTDAVQASASGNSNKPNTQSGAVQTFYHLDKDIALGATAYQLHYAEQLLVANNPNISFAGNFSDVSMRGLGPRAYDSPNSSLYFSPNAYNDTKSDGSTQYDTVVNGDQHYWLERDQDPSNIYAAQPCLPGTSCSSPGNDFQPGNGVASFVTRLANRIENLFSSEARSGSDYLVNQGGHADEGPIARSAIKNDDTHVTVTFKMDPNAPALQSQLSLLASYGAGWVISNGYDAADSIIYAVQAQIVGSYPNNQVMLTFSNTITPGLKLFHDGIGDGQVTLIDYYDHVTYDEGMGPNSPGFTKWDGRGSSIYDSAGMPITVSAFGLSID